jgi:glycogen debranching enzyme
MAGIHSRAESQREPYVAAGDRAYLIGTQDGDFPELGGHVPGEMGGLWLHPIKLIDGFWATIMEGDSGREVALSKSAKFINYPHGNRFRYGVVLDSLEVERFQFSPDGQPGVVVQYKFINSAARPRMLSLRFGVKPDLLPVWFSDQIGIKDAADTVSWLTGKSLFTARDREHPWFVVWGATTPGARRVDRPDSLPTSTHSLSLDARGSATLTFVFAGSTTTRKQAENAWNHLARSHAQLLATKEAHYASIIQRARVRIPDQRLQEVYNWVRINVEWLVRDVPGLGRGLSGGLMEYPWWFGTDASYSLQALMATGDFALVKHTLRLLRSRSDMANGNGRILHEVTTNGGVSNPGNTQETAQFIYTVGRFFQWSGDLEFAREMYPAMTQGLHWLLSDVDRNRNLFPEGYGIMEVLGLNKEVIDVAVYTQQALEAAARVAGALGERQAAARYRELAAQLATRINQRFWLEDDVSYGDFYGTRDEAISVAEGAIKQINLKGADKLTERDRQSVAFYQGLKQKWSAFPDTTRAWITNENWVITTPVETGIAPRDRAIRLLDRIRKENVGEYGPYLSATEKQAMMTISTGVQAVAEAQYGRIDQALWYVDRIVQTFNRKLPGSISEMMPDYGCFTIAWTSYGIVVPLIQHVFGIEPDAPNKTVVFDPDLPAGWEDISIEDLPVGSNLISFSRARTERGVEYTVTARDSGWKFLLKGIALPGAKYLLNGKPVSTAGGEIALSGRKSHVLVVP